MLPNGNKAVAVKARKSTLCVALVVYLSACSTTPTKKQGVDRWFSEDKVAHFFFSALIAGAVSTKLQREGESPCTAAIAGASAALVLGASKEWVDEHIRHTHWSHYDMAYNALGATTGGLSATDC